MSAVISGPGSGPAQSQAGLSTRSCGDRSGAARAAETRLALRNGRRPRVLTTTAGDLELRIPKLRTDSFFPSLLERRRRVDQALFAVVLEAYLHGVSTRKVDDLVKALGAARGGRCAPSAPPAAGGSRHLAVPGDRGRVGERAGEALGLAPIRSASAAASRAGHSVGALIVPW
jgi:hypothetical protein